nr:uncharacterized protein LOC123774512 [Procambarus clarkii]
MTPSSQVEETDARRSLHNAYSISDCIFPPFSDLPSNLQGCIHEDFVFVVFIFLNLQVLAVLLVAAVGSPLPHDCKHEVFTYGGAEPTGPLQRGHHVSSPVIHRVEAYPVNQYQATYPIGTHPAHITYNVAYGSSVSHALPQPVQPTPEAQRATAAFMAAWNEAAARATQIQTILVKSAPSGTYTIEIPKHVEAIEEVKRATAQFMAAWNQAARRATVVQHAVYSLPQPLQQTEDLKKTTAEFMASWEAAAQQASAIRHAVAATASSGVPQQVQATYEVKKATTEFIAAWRNAVVRVPTIQTNLYQITGTTPYSAVPSTVDGVPQFTPEVAHATTEFTRVWNAAAAAPSDVNIIMGASSQPAHQAITYTPSYHHAPSVSYDAASPSALLQPVQPTPEVQRATAAFMAAWNEAAARATQIQTILVRSAPSGTYTIEIPKHVEAIEEVKGATAEFLAAWNKAARRATVVQQAAYSLPQPVHQTENLKNATAEFMASWEAAARQASAIRHAVTSTASSGDPQQVEATYEVKKATSEFIAAWRNAVVRVPTIQTNLYQITGTTPYSAVPTTVDGVPQFTPEVAHATAEFTRVWNAAAAAPSDVNIIMGASSQRPSLKASHHAGTYSQPSYHHAPASVSYDAASPSVLPHPVQPTPEPVQPTPEAQRATAAFMAAWNEAAARATQIQTILVKSAPSGTYTIEIPKHVEAIEEVKRATAQFMAAWNQAARRATVVQHAVYSLPQPLQQTEDLKKTTAEFMASWEAAAQQASAIRHAVAATASSGVPQQVQATYEVKKATTEFIAAWRNAVVRVPTIQTNLYQITGTTPYSAVPSTVDGVPQFTPEVAHATTEFTRVWNAAVAAAAAAPDKNIIMGDSSWHPSLKAAHQAITYIQPSYHHAPASVSYDAASPSALLQPVQPTPEVQRATAAFMAAWNEAAARATQIQTILVRSAPSGTYTIEIPKHVEAIEEVKGATAEFLAAWNKAARRATVVQQAAYSLPQPVHQTENLKNATAEFMASWEAAARQASAIRHAVTSTASSGDPQQVEATYEVKKATSEFIAAWRNAVVRVPTIQTNLYQITGTTPYSAVPTTVDGVPQFTPEVAHATAEFTRVWNAAAAAPSDVNIIMGASSQRPSLKASHHAGTYSQPSYHHAPASVSYDAASPSVLPHPVQPTPEVQRATAAFMAAWNEATARASQIQTILVRSAPSGTYTIEFPKQVEAAEEVKGATAHFMAAWNKAARRATVVQQAVYSLPQPVHQTENLKKTIAEFMASWEAAAQQASAIRHAVAATASSGDPQQVEATNEVKKATTEFIAAWRNAVVRVPTIQTNLYQITGTTPYSAVPTTVDGVPQFTPEVAHATAEFTRVWNAAAAAPSDVNIIMGASSQRPSLKASHHAGTYSQPSYHHAPASVSYDAASPSALPHPVQPTPEVQRATAAFMVAWNEATARASQIETILVRSAPSGTYTIEFPKQVEAAEEVKGATAHFMAAWNKAARRATVVQQAVYSLPQPLHQTENLKKTIAEFMASWEAAAQQASAIRHAVAATASSGDPQQVEATNEVKKATTEFIAAWRNAVVRVPTIQTNLYQITGTTPYSAVSTSVDGVPQFTPEVAHATAEFMKVWNAAVAAAAAAPDKNIIMGDSSWHPSLKAAHQAITYIQPSYHHAPASVSYDAASPSALLQPVQPTPEVQRATAAFMAAWNEAAARATQIQTILVRSAPSGTYTIEIPKHVEAIEEVKGATAEFLAAWNKAARRATVVQQAAYSLPQPVHQTENLKNTTAEFMASWEAAARHASAIRHAITSTASSGDLQQVEATYEVKKATTEFIAAWRNAVVRVPTIQTNLYQITGTTPYSAVPTTVDGVPQFTPEVAHATAEFTRVWNAAAAAPSDVNIIMGASSQRPSLKASHHAGTYSQPSYHHAPASVSYDAASPSALPHPVQPTPEVQRATAAFMAAWNEATARASQIQTILVRSAPSGTYTIEFPKQVEAAEEVKGATAHFMAAWNKAARRATVVQQAVYSLPQPVHQTENLKKTIAEFMASWEAAAQQASAIRHAVAATASSGDPQQVEATNEVKKATTEFIAAWRNAVVRVPTIQTNLYQITGTTPYSAVPTTVDGVPQFTPEVAHATAEFTRVWNAAAAAPSDASHHAGTYSQPSYHHAPASVSYDAASPSALPHPVQPTPEVQRATAAFMVAWNEATARASQIETILVRSAPSGTYTIEFPKQVEAAEEVKGATAHFMAAWNKAARRATVVQQAVYSLPQPVHQTENLKKTIAEFMASWEAAAQQASAIRHAVAATASSGDPQQVEATNEVKKATTEFIAAWRNAVVRVPTIQTNLYQITGTTPYSAVSTSVDGVPQFTPEVAHATAEFMKVWNAAVAAAAAAPDKNIIMGDSSWRPSLKAAHQAITYTQPSYHYAPASVSYDAASPSALLQPVQPTPEVQRATAAFMAAWNEAAARATQIQTILVRSAPSGTYTIEIPKHVEAIEEVKGATAEFLAAWNKAARRATVVQQAAYSLPQPVHQTENLKNTTAEFMASWEAAARHASAIRHAITSTASSGDLQQVEATYEVKKATTEFIAAWRNAVVRVPTIQTNLYQITGTTPYSAVPTTVDGVPQFTPEVAHATAEFTRVWNAAAAAPSDVNIIMGASSQRPSLKASHHAGTYSQPSYHYAPASVSYDAASPSALLQPVQPTPEVQRATAAFMAAWNEAAARATQIQTILVRSAPSGTYTIEIPKHVEAIEEVKGATAEFLAAWNKAARRATVVQQAAYSLPQPVHQTENLKNTTAEFMASWEAAARQASAIRYAVTSTASSGDLQQVEATYEVKKATTEFIAAWRNAVVRVPTIQTNLYQITGTTPYSAVPTTVDGVPQFTPEVAHATAEFTRVWNAAAAAPSDVNIIMGASSQRPSLKASHHAGTYSQPSYHYAPASLSYDAASPSALLQPVQPTPEVQRATAAFMAAWNEAAVRATQIQTILVRSAPSGTYTIEIPKHVEAIEEVKGATTEFLAAWNKAARRATVVKQAAYSLPQPVHQTENLKNTTAEFMASWEAAARQASAIRHVVTTTASSGDRQQVKATYEVKKATTEFIAAWRNAVVRVPTIQTNLYQITGTTPYSAVPTTVDGVPQFTPEVAHATAEFTRVWNAAAAAPSDVNIIMGASSQRPSLKASHHAGTYSQPSYHHAPASVSYDAASPSALPHPVQPTPEVQRATAAFMVAWNEATARASQIQTILVRSAPSGTYTIEFPKQVEAAEEVKGATAHFMAAWNKAARRATVVQQAVYSLPQPVHQTENLKKTIAEFMASWEAAAQQASAIRHAVAATASSGDPQQVEATNEVKKATTEFIAAWRNAVVRVPTIQTNLYQITGTTPYSAVSTSVDGVPQFTPEVAHATAEFMKVWNAAVAAAAAAPDKNIIMGDSSWRPSLKAAHQAITYSQPSYHYAPASVSYDAASPSALLQPVQPMPEVQRATAAFMAAWNEAAARATQIQTILVRSAPSGTYTIEFPKQVEAAEEVKGATAHFMAAWNKAARRATVVQQAAYSLPQPVHQTENLKNTTAEFMASWEAAARHASAIRHAVTSTASSGDPQQVEATYEVKKATTEFIAAWRNAVVRVPTIQTNLYQITGTTPYSAVPTTVDGVPQFTPEVAHATAEFTRVWNAAAAAPSDVNIIMGASSQRPPLKASHHAGTYSQPSYHYAPASVSYDAASPSALLQPVQPTPEVQRATAAFMAAWNEAAARATQIQTILVRSAPSGTYTIEIPKHVEAIEEVKVATAEFLAAWNKAARRATVVQQAAYSLPQPVHQTENLKNTTAEFMASWEAAARHASAIRHAVTSTASSGDPQQVEATYEVKKATTEFIAAWRNAVVRVPTIQTNLYQITGTTPYSAVPITVDGVPQFTPEVAHATAEFTRVWNAAAAAPSDVNIIMGASSQRPSLKASHHAGTYSQPSYHYAPASVSYDAASPSALFQPVQPTPEVQRATAAFMAAWNEAAVRATQIQTILVRSAPSGTYAIEIPKHVEAIEEVKGATTEFLAAWNKAARRATVVQQAAYSLPQPVHQTENLKNTTAEFMASWEAAARQASAIRHAVTSTASSGDRQQVKATYEVKKATTEFIAAWRNAVVRVPTIQTNLYQITGTTPYSAVPTTVDGVPQFTPEVAHATAEFTRVWNAAAAAPSDVNIIMGASSQRPSLKASHHAGTYSQPSYHHAPASVSYDAASPSALPHPVQPTPEVQRATAAFMVAWNEATARASQIQTILVRSAPSGTYTIEFPKQVEAAEEVKGATAHFMAAWNKAARRATVVQQAVYSVPQPVHQTENLKKTIAEFMASWEAAAQQASAIRHAVAATASSGDPQQVEATNEVKKATTEFIAAWRNAVVRVPTIQTNLYQITGTTPYSAVSTSVDGVPQFTPEVAHATAEFMKVWNAAVAAAAAAPDKNIIMGDSSWRPSLKAAHQAITYSQPSYHYAPASLSYDAASPSALLQPVQPTPEVQRATAAFMAAWNEAAARATQIQTILVRSAPSGTYTIEIPKHVEAIEEVKVATAEFLAAWNKAARRATVVQQAAYSLPQPVHQTENLKNTTAEFMASWEAAARHASVIRHAVTSTASSGDPQQVEATYEVKKATTEFIAAWRNAVVRVPTIQTNLYQITGTTPYSAVPTTVDGVPQFTPEVAHATAEFTRVWNAAAAAPSDVNIIMGASSQRPSLKASHHAGTYSQPSYHYAPASLSYDAASPSALLQPVQPTPEVQRATAAFMAAWNEAAVRATQIQTILVRSAPSGTYAIEIPKHVEAIEEVKGATTEFLAAWNKAARRATVVQQAAYSLPQPVHQTENLKNTTAEFMASWEAAARQASAIKHAVTSTASSGDRQQVKATYEVKKATTEFIAAWRNAVVRVPTIQTNLYQITGTTPYSAVPTTVDGVPQFTPEVAHATAEFTRVWNAAAAAPSDVNIIMGASSQRPSLKASHHAGTYSQPSYHHAPASVSYDATSPSALPHPVQPTPEVQRATAAFMVAWNEATARASQIQTILVRSAPSGTYTIEFPKQVEAAEEVKGATAHFMAAWNKAARRATVVQQAVYSVPQPVHQTENLKKTIAEFMASWEAAAQQASAIRHAVAATASSGDPQQVEATNEVKKATTEFIAAWRNAVVRVPTIQTNLYQITGTTPYSAVSTSVDGVPQFTPEVAHATAEFMKVWNAAVAAAAAAPDKNIIMGDSSWRPSLKAAHQAITYSQPSYHYAPASLSYDAASPSALLQPVQPTPEVQRATAAFMAAWNEAAARATQIQTILVRSAPSSTYTIEIPKHVEAIEEVKVATAEFLAAWNKAARRATVVQQAAYSLPQPVHQTENLKNTTAEFMASWEAAAQQASAIRHAVSATASSGDPQQVEASYEVKKATTEFIAAWRNAVVRVPTIQTNLYQITGTIPYSAVPTTVDGVPQFTPEVAHATAEFTRVWNAAAAAPSDVNIIMGASSQRPSLKASHHAGTYSQPSYHHAPASVSYDAASPSALPHPVQPTPEVQRATAAFMAAWNEATARASQIQTILVRSAPSGTYTIEFPKHVEAIDEVKGATAQFMAAWNKAARRATVVKHAVYSLPQPLQQTEDLKKTTAQFLVFWEAAAQRASAIRHAVAATASSGVPQQVEATYEFKRATEEFMAAWRKAAARMRIIQTNLYQITGTSSLDPRLTICFKRPVSDSPEEKLTY